ncbi:pentapeptide repeat protein [Gloeothece citriformis PCC 7424]|uniref:Pentapeptide repeat protein n=1 Tax=Gloeothece citriformis (strain PCC 7424) TaxID=65393 RepID=B7KJA4_GLOC7|nr:pentapeptide repeat-containing protein [Gloeothece citriformis]ACK72188.1 pentapeptide repeat protein [Gloeothece citriformis PCC 7424]
MKISVIIITAVWTTLGVISPVKSENLNDLRQFLATKQCQECDLSGAGLVLANLAGADLRGANLAGANLSQANLSGANLAGANLSGASFNGANLSGANLRGAIVNGTDFRNVYFINADLTGVMLNNAYLQGAVGIPDYAGNPEMFYGWGLVENKQGNYKSAIEYYNRAIYLNPKYAEAYLARSMASYRLGNTTGATQDAQAASQLFEEQQNPAGYQAAENFLQGMQAMAERQSKPPSGSTGGIERVIQSVGSILLQFFLY